MDACHLSQGCRVWPTCDDHVVAGDGSVGTENSRDLPNPISLCQPEASDRAVPVGDTATGHHPSHAGRDQPLGVHMAFDFCQGGRTDRPEIQSWFQRCGLFFAQQADGVAPGPVAENRAGKYACAVKGSDLLGGLGWKGQHCWAEPQGFWDGERVYWLEGEVAAGRRRGRTQPNGPAPLPEFSRGHFSGPLPTKRGRPSRADVTWGGV
jgi:hypothetical protein